MVHPPVHHIVTAAVSRGGRSACRRSAEGQDSSGSSRADGAGVTPKEGVRFPPARATRNFRLQGLSVAEVTLSGQEHVSGCVARRRACPRVSRSWSWWRPRPSPSGRRSSCRRERQSPQVERSKQRECHADRKDAREHRHSPGVRRERVQSRVPGREPRPHVAGWRLRSYGLPGPRAAGGSSIEARRSTRGVSGTRTSPRTGRSRSKVIRSSTETNAAASTTETTPRARIAR